MISFSPYKRCSMLHVRHLPYLALGRPCYSATIICIRSVLITSSTSLVSTYLATMAPLSILLLFAVLVIGTTQGYVAYNFIPRYRGSKYMVSKNAEPFDLAKMNGRCKGSGGYLLQLDSYREYRYVKYELALLRERRLVYTGITDLGSEGRFYNYNDKKPAAYLRWRRRQPDNWRGYEHCVNLTYYGLNDIGCDGNALYICEIPV
ncbi:mannose-binding protein c [Plakobranchus ocellatus]|uniref:Mannose-binding protein c n=1 Tax=Plakobranchus ocellatus TaxID=259542 RepID=A0AAV3ZQ95_9GAST|nr:mannose-binding protein c [Plakobranchus ocellatus]